MSMSTATKLLPLSEYNVFGSPRLDTNLMQLGRHLLKGLSQPLGELHVLRSKQIGPYNFSHRLVFCRTFLCHKGVHSSDGEWRRRSDHVPGKLTWCYTHFAYNLMQKTQTSQTSCSFTHPCGVKTT